MDMTTPIVDAAQGDVVLEQQPVNAAGDTLVDTADLRQKARSQEFSAAWSDEWNPNPLSDVSL